MTSKYFHIVGDIAYDWLFLFTGPATHNFYLVPKNKEKIVIAQIIKSRKHWIAIVSGDVVNGPRLLGGFATRHAAAEYALQVTTRV